MENSSQSTTNSLNKGCGPNTRINITINPTTGGDFYLTVENDITVENLKNLISKRLKVPRDKISLLFRDKQLQHGNLYQNGICEGSRITLLPNVETGLLAHRHEIGIMQALESLNDTQISEFLCGKAPLNLSMRLGDQMMLIQLQLSTITARPYNPSNSPAPNPPSLLQASRNLQHTLRKLSTDVFSGSNSRGRREKNVYSGTFSGALNPALQDTKGRPRRDIATIVHILNDLLCSVPEFRRIHFRGEEASVVANNDTNSNFDEPLVPIQPANEDQNSRTRGKLEHLRLVMGEKRERRRQRKQKPYSLPSSDGDTVIA